jgi:GT2 family glycosyltransferase
MTHSPFVVIIILNWNNLRDVIRCLESIHHHDYLNFKVIVVDNGSETKPDQYIHEKFPDVEMVSSHKNLGYTGGNNLGIIKGLELQAEYFWLLNGDAIATRDCLSLLIEYAETHKEAGLISPVICSSTDNNQILYCGSYIDFENQYGLTAKKIEDIKVWQDMEPKRIALWGTALLIPKRVVEVVGYLNDKLFAYYEDMDYSARVIKAGFENKVVTDAKVFHRSEGNPNRKSYYQ